MRTKHERIAELLAELLIIIFPEQPSRSVIPTPITPKTALKASPVPAKLKTKAPKLGDGKCTGCGEERVIFNKKRQLCVSCYKKQWLAQKAAKEDLKDTKAPEATIEDVKKN